MPASTFNEIAGTAFTLLNVFLPGESVPASDAQLARKLCNLMLSTWRQQTTLIPVTARERFDLITNRGGPTNPYTVGPGGTINTDPRPPNQNSIVGANLILTATSPEVRVPLWISTTNGAFANAIPGMTSTQPTSLFYNPTYADDLGSLYLSPVPDNATNDLELFIQKPLVSFDDLTTEYDFPDSADDAISYNLAQRLAGPYGRDLTDSDAMIARTSLGVFRRSNIQLSDLANDASFASARRSLYNIYTGG